MKNLKTLIISILIPNIVGIISSLFGNSSMSNFIQPSFAPPGILFPIVWTILYTLMGISFYLIYEESNNTKAIFIYIIQLLVNSLWTFFFFNLGWYLFSFFWILLLIVLVLIMIKEFFKINRVAAYLQIPYLLWLIFAAILNYNIYLLN